MLNVILGWLTVAATSDLEQPKKNYTFYNSVNLNKY